MDEAHNKINDDDNGSVEVIDVESSDDDDKDEDHADRNNGADDIDDKQIHSAIFIQRKEISANFLEGTANLLLIRNLMDLQLARISSQQRS